MTNVNEAAGRLRRNDYDTDRDMPFFQEHGYTRYEADCEALARAYLALVDETGDLATYKRWFFWLAAGINLPAHATVRGCSETQLDELKRLHLGAAQGKDDRRTAEAMWQRELEF